MGGMAALTPMVVLVASHILPDGAISHEKLAGKSLTNVFERCAERLSCSWQYRHLLFAIATLIVVLFTGYHFGTFDQAIHIPFLKKFADPTLFPGDAFFDMRFQHRSCFWFLWLPLYRLGVLEIAIFVVHVMVTYLTFWAIWALSDTLYHDPGASLLGTVVFVIPHIGFGGFPVLEFSLLNRTFVLPFLLWTMVLYLRRHYVLL